MPSSLPVALGLACAAGIALASSTAHAKETARADGARLVGSELVVKLKGKELRGEALKGAIFQSRLPDGGEVDFRIDRYIAPTTGGMHQYVVSARGDTDAWQPFCNGDDVPSVPLQGVWTDDGAKRASKEFTFACTDAALGKCVTWGYHPWTSKLHADLHQACTRLVRADYCGTGESFTRDGTEVNVVDALGVQKDDHAKDARWEVEAEWTPKGARCVNRPRVPGTQLPTCAKKLLKKGCGARKADGTLKSGAKLMNEVRPVAKAP